MQFTRSIAVEREDRSIRANAVAPWYIRTPLTEPVLAQPERLGQILSRTPMKLAGTPEKIAAGIAFLCMDKASFITGHTVCRRRRITCAGIVKRTLAITCLTVLNLLGLCAQEVPVWEPEIGFSPDFGPEVLALYARRDLLMDKDSAGLNNEERAELDSLLRLHDESDESPYDIIGGGCSWYCGGGPDGVWATSYLNTENGTPSLPENANDLSYGTAWVTGAHRQGVGEILSYRFTPESPRIHSIFISNGAVSDPTQWNTFHRVRRLLIRENNIPLAIFALEDTPEVQSFRTPLLGRRSDGTEMVLSFEILEIYKGRGGGGTAITEIWFDGIDVH